MFPKVESGKLFWAEGTRMIHGFRGIGNGGCLGQRADETDRWAKAWLQSSGTEMHLVKQ